MGLEILCAGCSPDERGLAEGAVRAALAAHPAWESWRLSLVKMQDRWSVTIDGPEAKGLAITAADGRLQQSIAEALRKGLTAESNTEGKVERADEHLCAKCRQPFQVSYAGEPGEAMALVPVACPRCWQITQIQVAQGAGLARDYRADKLDL